MATVERRGFTLIEVVVVIIVIAIASAVLTPAYSRYVDHSQFDAKAEQVHSLFAWARQQAVTNDATCTVTWDPGTHVLTAQPDAAAPVTDLPAVDARQSQNANSAAQSSSNGQPPSRTVDLSDGFDIPDLNVTLRSTLVRQDGGSQGGGGTQKVVFQSDGTSDFAQFSLVRGYRARWTLSPATGTLSRSAS